MKNGQPSLAGHLGSKLAARVADLTLQKTRGIGLRHAKANLPHIHSTLADLKIDKNPQKRSAIVLSAGPSLHSQHIAERLKDLQFEGLIVTTDGALGYCLRNGIVPDYVLSVDPHPTRIVRWYGDTDLKDRPADDYFRRQDLDPHWLNRETQKNQELIDLVNRHGPRIKAILATSVSPSVTQRVLQAGMRIYWWNPIYDDYDKPKSLTRQLLDLTKAPCMMTGGNSGTSAWVLAGSVLGAKRIAMVGMDLSYPPGTRLEFTQYYKNLKGLLGSQYKKAFISLKNPYLKQTWFTDPAYWWYRKSFLYLAAEAPFVTYNCTGGGILFGKGIHWTSLESFVKNSPRVAAIH